MEFFELTFGCVELLFEISLHFFTLLVEFDEHLLLVTPLLLKDNVELLLELLQLLVNIVSLLDINLKLRHKVIIHLAVLFETFLQDFVIVSQLRVEFVAGG